MLVTERADWHVVTQVFVTTNFRAGPAAARTHFAERENTGFYLFGYREFIWKHAIPISILIAFDRGWRDDVRVDSVWVSRW